MSDASKNESKSAEPAHGAPPAGPVIHRVCITCNNMFRVPADRFEAKQCSNCHKG